MRRLTRTICSLLSVAALGSCALEARPDADALQPQAAEPPLAAPLEEEATFELVELSPDALRERRARAAQVAPRPEAALPQARGVERWVHDVVGASDDGWRALRRMATATAAAVAVPVDASVAMVAAEWRRAQRAVRFCGQLVDADASEVRCQRAAPAAHDAVSLRPLVGLERLDTLVLEGARVTNTQLLPQLRHLETLTLLAYDGGSPPIAPEDLGQLPALRRLTVGRLSQGELVALVRAVPQLEALTVHGAPADLSPLASLSHLRALEWTSAYPANLAPLRRLPLEALRLNVLTVLSQPVLGTLPLRRLTVTGAPLASLRPLRGLADTLESLALWGPEAPPSPQLVELLRLRRLRLLSLENTDVEGCEVSPEDWDELDPPTLDAGCQAIQVLSQERGVDVSLPSGGCSQ